MLAFMITRDLLRDLRPRIEAALAELATETGLHITVGNASFTPSNATFKLEIATTDATGEVQTKETTAFKSLARSYGLEPDDLGKHIRHNGTEYEIQGLAPKSWRFPILARRIRDGKVFKLPAEAVSRQLHPDKSPGRIADVSGLLQPPPTARF